MFSMSLDMLKIGEPLKRCLFIFFVICSSGITSTALAAFPFFDSQQTTLAPMLKEVTPAVVNVSTFTEVTVRSPLLRDPFFRYFFGIPEGMLPKKRTQSAGSGVIIDAGKGYVITNYHVIKGADVIEITLLDGRSFTAKLLGVDEQVDLAVLKIDSTDLVQISIGSSRDLEVGDFVLAIGNPFGIGQTVTSGIVSALGRSGIGIQGYEDFIQTDASINPGNSGGALVNLKGELIGVNTAILAPSGGNIGIGFAIPVHMMNIIADQIIRYGNVRRGYLSIAVQSLTPELKKGLGLNDNVKGVVVADVDEGSVINSVGIQVGDIITHMGGRKIEHKSDFDSEAAIVMVGDDLDVRWLRNNKVYEASIEITHKHTQFAGGKVSPKLEGGHFRKFYRKSQEGIKKGLEAINVVPGSVVWRYGLRQGDIIVAANDSKVSSVEDLRKEVKKSPNRLVLYVFRESKYGYLILE